MIDGDEKEEHKRYRYGGMWKNKHEAVSAKKPRKSKEVKQTQSLGQVKGLVSFKDSALDASGVKQWDENGRRFVKNDKVLWDGRVWVCRKSHSSNERKTPGSAYSLWKEDTSSIVEAG